MYVWQTCARNTHVYVIMVEKNVPFYSPPRLAGDVPCHAVSFLMSFRDKVYSLIVPIILCFFVISSHVAHVLGWRRCFPFVFVDFDDAFATGFFFSF